MHAASRGGLTDAPTWAAFPFAGVVPPLPAVKPQMSGELIRLPIPDVARMTAADPPLVTVMEQRRSVRRYGGPLTVGQLGEFLYRIGRVRSISGPDQGNPKAYETSNRTYPSAGGAYRPGIYPVVRECAGIAAGMYHYQPVEHALSALRPREAYLRRLLYRAYTANGGQVVPQVLLVITSRFGRLSWKYRGIAYADTLRDVGVLYEAMYLAAIAMGLAPCALGSGDSGAFGAATRLDPLRRILRRRVHAWHAPRGRRRLVGGPRACGSLTVPRRPGALTAAGPPARCRRPAPHPGRRSPARDRSAPVPLRAFRSTQAARTRPATGSLASIRSIRMPRSWWNMPGPVVPVREHPAGPASGPAPRRAVPSASSSASAARSGGVTWVWPGVGGRVEHVRVGGRDVHVAADHRVVRARRDHVPQRGEPGQLVAVVVGVRGSPVRHVERVHPDPAAGRGHRARLGFGEARLSGTPLTTSSRPDLGQDRHAVPLRLAVEGGLVAPAASSSPSSVGERIVGELGLLQADHVGLPLVQPRQQPRYPLLGRVHVPGRYSHPVHNRLPSSLPQPRGLELVPGPGSDGVPRWREKIAVAHSFAARRRAGWRASTRPRRTGCPYDQRQWGNVTGARSPPLVRANQFFSSERRAALRPAARHNPPETLSSASSRVRNVVNSAWPRFPGGPGGPGGRR